VFSSHPPGGSSGPDCLVVRQVRVVGGLGVLRAGGRHGVARVPPIDDGAAAAAGRRLDERRPRTTSVPRISQALATVGYANCCTVLLCVFRQLIIADRSVGDRAMLCLFVGRGEFKEWPLVQ